MKEFAYMKVGGRLHSASKGGTGWKMPLRLSFVCVLFVVLVGSMLHFFSVLMDLKDTFQKVSMKHALYAFQCQS